jgi:hypothetical protein
MGNGCCEGGKEERMNTIDEDLDFMQAVIEGRCMNCGSLERLKEYTALHHNDIDYDGHGSDHCLYVEMCGECKIIREVLIKC